MTSSQDILTIIRPDDWHVHLRDGKMLRGVVGHTAAQFARAIVMPNLQPPVVTTQQAQAYRERILDALAASTGAAGDFTPLMTLYLTDETAASEIYRAHESGIVYGVKLYPAGATTNSAAGVTDLMGRCRPALDAMQEVGMPLLVHGEVTDPAIDIFDREAVFIERVLDPLRRAYPALKIVFEHLTTKDGVDYVAEAQGPLAATITAHHLLYDRNALFQGGLRPHYYCLPVLKRAHHRDALLDAAVGDTGRFFLGTDSAPHPRDGKESACGCAGCYTALHALELYASAFDAMGRLDALEAFASRNGAAFYGLPLNNGTITLKRERYDIPTTYDAGDEVVVPLAAGESLSWRVVGA